ncbi:SGNH/GDSL hydrolase family protein [Nocardioides acrostichi]|uniref:SGNH/GDSL hydrolase family protein n=1 Tax=Nocardioides acrostichi TaxID=2784339 RepID=A0A930UUS9_9ACTN|nr:SGNH/GDSL hydrolase family protein [Nocardioides acrostichi]MBF4161238.1 SGNH/GDSL hydrolase family protein [Nocardioides acrostichi]
MAESPRFLRYVAVGDSFTEGVGDDDPSRPHGVRGWADRVAEVLAARDPAFGYANLAIRGRKLDQILAEQIEAAMALEPDLVSIYAGANDILRPRVDLDALLARYDDALARIAASGAHLVVFTAFDPGGSAVYRPIRPRFERYSDFVRDAAARHGATLVDYWHLTEFRDWGYWSEDRMHMGTPGHARMAAAVLDALGFPHDLPDVAPSARAPGGLRARVAADAEWLRTGALPWVHRRLTGRSSGDGLSPRWPIPVRPAGADSGT